MMHMSVLNLERNVNLFMITLRLLRLCTTFWKEWKKKEKRNAFLKTSIYTQP